MHDEEFHRHHNEANASTSVEEQTKETTNTLCSSVGRPVVFDERGGTRLSSTIAEKLLHVNYLPVRTVIQFLLA